MPSLSVVHTVPSRAQERRPRGLLAAEADRAVEQPGHEPLEADRHLDAARRPRSAATRSIIDDDTSVLPIAASARQPGAVRVEVLDRDREVVVRVHQPGVGRDDAVPVGVRVVAGGDVGTSSRRLDQRGHRGGRRAVHPDLAVPVERHEPPGRVDERVDHGQVEPVRSAIAPQ